MANGVTRASWVPAKESVRAWAPYEVEVAGVDFAPGLVELARARLPDGAHRIWLGDASVWEPPMKFDFAHVRLDLGHTTRVARWCRRLIVSSDGSFRRPDSPKAEDVGARLRAMGLHVTGELYHRSDEHQVELRVAFCG